MYGQCDMLADLGPVFGSLGGRLAFLCSAGRWSARLLWTTTMFGQCDVPANLGPVLAVSAGDWYHKLVQCGQMVSSSVLGTAQGGLASAGRRSARLLWRLPWEV